MMTLQESCNLFQIHNIDEIDQKTLKRKYHKMCLKYHPDKNKKHQHQRETQNEFVKMKECYETLNAYIETNQKNKYQNCHTEKGGDRVQHANIYETLISLISVENIEYVLKLIDSYKIYMNHSPEVITLNVTMKQVFDKCVYVTNEHYIPLWHKIIHQFSVKEQKHMIYIIKMNNVPPHVCVMKNNDIIIKIPKKSININEYNVIKICDKVERDVYISDSDYEKAFLMLREKGIPKTNTNDIFDSSQMSNIHLHLI
jgi:hypothetical protein